MTTKYHKLSYSYQEHGKTLEWLLHMQSNFLKYDIIQFHILKNVKHSDPFVTV